MVTELEDGEYMLMQYDPENKNAKYIQKVTVKDGQTKYIISEGGDYFIAEKVFAGSIDELDNEEAEENVEDYYLSSEKQDDNSPILPFAAGVISTLVVVGVVLLIMKKKGLK